MLSVLHSKVDYDIYIYIFYSQPLSGVQSIVFLYGNSVGEHFEKISFCCDKHDHGLSGPSGCSQHFEQHGKASRWTALGCTAGAEGSFENVLLIFDFKS